MDRLIAYELYARSVEYLRSSSETTPVETAEAVVAPPVEIAVVIEESEKETWLGLRVRTYDEETRRVVDDMKARGVVPEDVEILEVGRLIGFGPTDMVSPLQPGVACANEDGPPGTLGCVVNRGGVAHLISVNHIFALESHALPNSRILQPSAGATTLRAIGTLVDHEELLPSGNLIDGAIATIEVGDVDERLFDVGKRITVVRTADLHTGDRVFKFGQASGRTEGRIRAPKASNVTLHMDFGSYTFDEQIEIEPGDSGEPFAVSGDSGALVYDENDEAIGLVVGGNAVDRTYLSPIQRILTRFGATLA